jgi:hypothetical protein
MCEGFSACPAPSRGSLERWWHRVAERRTLRVMGIRGRVVAGVVLVAVAGVLASWVSKPPRTTAATTAVACGVERWTVKTLQDRPLLIPRRDTTIAYLVRRPTPAVLPDRRLLFERHVFRVTAAVTLVRPEDDGDFHLVLRDAAGRTMIAESPNGACDRRATLRRRLQMAAARARVRLCARASVTGVAFFDFIHGQTGVAPNGIELHPVLAFRCLSATAASPPPRSSGKVSLVSVTSPVSAGSQATLIAAVPTGTSCSIVVTYKSGPSSAAGLYPKRSSSGRVSWTWTVGSRTTPGRWPIDVSCGAAGSLHTSFLVT